MHVVRRSLFILVTFVALAVPARAPAADVPIQPGGIVQSSIGQCTLNFVFSDANGRRYIGTAGHCVSAVGDRVTAPLAGSFGSVVYRRLAGADDFALIKVDTDKASLVSADVRGFGVPAGFTRSTETAVGDVLQLHGWGLLLSALPATRTRTGVLAADTASQYFAELPAIFGDSGGPIVHVASGKALGVVSGIGVTIPPSTLLGTTMERIRVLLDDAGFAAVTMVTA